MLLIYPPAVRSCEPPLGIARIANLLNANRRKTLCLDLCNAAYHWLFEKIRNRNPQGSGPSYLKRIDKNIEKLTSLNVYLKIDNYKKAVIELNKSLSWSLCGKNADISFTNYSAKELSPVRMEDLITSARQYKNNCFHPLFKSRIEEAFKKHNTDITGISINYLSQALNAFSVIGFIKNRFPDKKIIIGGGLVSSWVNQNIVSQDENFGGYVDKIFCNNDCGELLSYLNISANNISSLPCFDDFINNKYFSPGLIIPYNFSYGCSWKKCTFCPEKTEKRIYSSISGEDAIKDLKILQEKYRPVLFHFTDNEISPIHLNCLINNSLETPWYGFSRFYGKLTSPDYCRQLRKSGCIMLQLGLESGDQKVLDTLNKGTRLDNISVILRNLREAGIGTYVYVLFGTPQETFESAKKTIDFIEKHHDCISFINTAVFNMPIKSEEAHKLSTSLFYEGDLSLYCNFKHPCGWSRDNVRYFI